MLGAADLCSSLRVPPLTSRSRQSCKCAATSGHGASRQQPQQAPPLPPAKAPQQAAAAQQQQQQQAAPWALGNYYTKKLSRETDALGNIISSPDTIAAAPGWTPEAQLRLVAEALAAELRQDAPALLDQVRQLQALLPGMEGTLRRMKPAELVRMAAQLEQITPQLVMLRSMLPSSADVAAIVAAHPPLLRMGAEEVESALGRVRDAFPDASEEDLGALLSIHGFLLDGGNALESCLRGVGHLMSRPQIMRCLQRDPAFLYQFQPLERQSRGERDAEYLADMYRPG